MMCYGSGSRLCVMTSRVVMYYGCVLWLCVTAVSCYDVLR